MSMITAAPEIEALAIASLCGNNEQVKMALLAKINANHFGLYATRLIFEHIMTYIKNSKELPSLGLLKSDPSLIEEGRTYLGNLQEAPLEDKDDVARAFEILEQYRQVRVLTTSAEALISKIKVEDPDIKAIQEDMEKTLMTLKSPEDEDSWVHSGEGDNADPYVSSILHDNAPPLIKTGFTAFDEAAGGLEKTGEFIISTIPGGGKSTMAMQLGINMSSAGHSFCMISYEMNKNQCFNRYISNITKLPYEAIRLRRLTFNQKQLLVERYNKHKELLKEKKSRFTIFVPTDTYIIPEYKNLMKPFGYEVLAFDYINLIPGYDEKQMWERLLLHSLDGKRLAQQTNTLVMLLAQMDEDSGALRYGRAIRENCNNWWRWQYGEKERESHVLDIEQAKARDNKQFNFPLLENYEYMSIEDTGATVNTSNNNQNNKVNTMPGLEEDENDR